MKIKTILFAALLGLMSSAAFAASPAPAAATGGPGMKHENRCEKNQAECKAAAAKFDQWCSANAEKCMGLKAWAEKRREFCEANKQKCEEHRERMHKMHEKMKEKCAQNPDDEHCKMMKDMKADEPGDNEHDNDEGDEQAPPPPMVF